MGRVRKGNRSERVHRSRAVHGFDSPLALREAWLAKFCQAVQPEAMSTMNISLPDALKSFVDEQVSQRGYGTSSG